MDIRPTNTSSRSTAIHLQRHKPILRLLLVVVAGLALLGLALAVPAGMETAASIPPPTSNSQPPTPNFQPPTSNLQSPISNL